MQQNTEHPESLMFMTAGPHGGALPMTYSPFPTGDGSWTPTFDPSIVPTGFGFAGPNMMNPQHLQNQFYFPGADMGIWGQDPLNNPLLMNYPLLSPMAMDQQGSAMTLDGNVTNAIDPVAGLGQGFSGMALNGTMPGVIPVGQTPLIPNTPSTPGGIESSPQDPGTSASVGQSSAPQPEKPKSWAAIASQPAKPRPPPPPKPQPQPESHSLDSARKGQGGGNRPGGGQQGKMQGTAQGVGTSVGRGGGARRTAQQPQQPTQPGPKGNKGTQSDLVDRLHSENKYNPTELGLNLTNARYFVIKSYAEDDIHRSIKYSIWTSTEHGNRRLDQAFREQGKESGPIYLFFSVNGSGHFCGMAQMMSEVDFNTVTGVWAQDKWKGRFEVKWIYVKDVPNSQLRHIRLENNENKPVTNSRDTQEVPPEKGKQVVKIVHNYHHTTSIFDDFEHYEKKQEEDSKKVSRKQIQYVNTYNRCTYIFRF